eukprot:UN04557
MTSDKYNLDFTCFARIYNTLSKSENDEEANHTVLIIQLASFFLIILSMYIATFLTSISNNKVIPGLP